VIIILIGGGIFIGENTLRDTYPTECDEGLGSMTATVSGGQTYNYLWSNGETTRVAVSLTNGESWVTVTDANRNTKTINFNNVIISCYQKQYQSGEGLILWMVLVMVL
jgi:hypothetical protein